MTAKVFTIDPHAGGDEVSVLDAARDVLRAQARAVGAVADALGPEFYRALELVCRCSGRLIVCGVGKSGLIGRKIAATFTSTGTPSLFLHAGDAAHGDLGAVTPADAVLLISHSGATEELLRLVPYLEELGVPMVALVGQPGSPLGRAADVAIGTRVEREACAHNVVVTTSALVTLAIADALALAVMRRRNVGAGDLGRRHPGGALGRRLTRRVRDAMQRELPLVGAEATLCQALLVMAKGRSGIVIVADAAGAPLGIVGEDELAAALSGPAVALDRTVASVMSPEPVTVREDASLHAAEEKMQRLRLSALVVVDAEQRVTGIVTAAR